MLDVLQEDEDIVVGAELPGVKQEDVDITLHDGVLTISGERKAECSVKVLAITCGSGAMVRSGGA